MIQIEKMNPSILPVIGFTVESDTKTPIELNLIAAYVMKPYLSQIEGVSSVGILILNLILIIASLGFYH